MNENSQTFFTIFKTFSDLNKLHCYKHLYVKKKFLSKNKKIKLRVYFIAVLLR